MAGISQARLFRQKFKVCLYSNDDLNLPIPTEVQGLSVIKRRLEFAGIPRHSVCAWWFYVYIYKKNIKKLFCFFAEPYTGKRHPETTKRSVGSESKRKKKNHFFFSCCLTVTWSPFTCSKSVHAFKECQNKTKQTNKENKNQKPKILSFILSVSVFSVAWRRGLTPKIRSFRFVLSR